MKEEIQRAIERLSAFDREHASEAVEAATALGALGAEALCAALDAPEALNVPAARHALKDQIARQDPAAVAPALLRALAHGDWRPNQVASDAIGLMVDAMVPALIRNLETESEPNGRINTMVILRRMGVSAAGPAFAKLAREDAAVDVRAAAVEALGHLGVEEAGAAAVVALSDGSPLVRLKAVKAAGWLRAREAVDGVLAFARDADAEGRAAAVYALDRIGDTRAADDVVRLLKDPEPYVRWSAAVALRRLWTEGCEDAVHAAVGDEEETVAAAALETLCIAGPQRSRKSVLSAADDARPAVRRTATAYARTK